jgi:hypothetical protein
MFEALDSIHRTRREKRKVSFSSNASELGSVQGTHRARHEPTDLPEGVAQ